MITRVLSRRLVPLTLTAALAALAATAAGCGGSTAARTTTTGDRSAGFPVTVAAANGPVRIDKRPTAIISLSPTATEMLYAIGAAHQVKAVDSLSDYPPQAPRTKLSGYSPNVEAIVSYKPDLVVASFDAATLTKQLAAFGVPVLYLPAPSSLAADYAEFAELGAATGHARQAGQEVASLRRQINRIVAAAPHPAKPVNYYYELDQTYYSVTSATFVGRLLGLLGLKSIADAAKGAAASGGYPQLSAEYILKANPGYVILADTICCHQSAATVAKRPGWSGLSAVRDHHIIALNDDIASRWGPRIVDLLRAVVAGLASRS